jgi:hypothetical protein
MINVGRCPSCHVFLISEEFVNHTCEKKLQGIRTIQVSHYYETHEDREGHKMVFARGFDGYLYRLIVCKHNPPHSAKRNFTPNRNDDTNHRLDRTVELSVYRGMPYVISRSIT